MSEIFCPKCHKLAAKVISDGVTTKIVQNGKSIINAKSGGNNIISISCPVNHPVKVKF